MPKLPELESPTVRAIYRWYETRAADEEERGYLGASNIGDSCSRRLWYGFRWCGKPNFDGRMRRLFSSGHREEPRIVEELTAIGCEVAQFDDDGQQFEVSACSGHFKGHLDGAVLGLPEAPKTWHTLEVKTMNAKNYAEVKAKGVAVAQPRHHGQMQVYMGLTGMERAAYIVVNKDTDDLYLERVEFDKAVFDKLIAKAQSIIDAVEPPARISDDPSWFECKFCPHHELCHGVAAPPPNCRTCAHSTPFAAGQWLCEHHGEPIPLDVQRGGCDEHRHQPALVASFLELEDAECGNVILWRNKLNGATVRQPDYSSREIHKATDKAFLGNDFVAAMKTQFPGAQVVATRPVEDGEIRSDLAAVYE